MVFVDVAGGKRDGTDDAGTLRDGQDLRRGGLDRAGVEEDRGDAVKASMERVRPARVGLHDFGFVRQTSGVWMPADGADLRATGEQLGNEGRPTLPRRSGDQDHVNSLSDVFRSKGRKRPPESDSADEMRSSRGRCRPSSRWEVLSRPRVYDGDLEGAGRCDDRYLRRRRPRRRGVASRPCVLDRPRLSDAGRYRFGRRRRPGGVPTPRLGRARRGSGSSRLADRRDEPALPGPDPLRANRRERLERYRVAGQYAQPRSAASGRSRGSGDLGRGGE